MSFKSAHDSARNLLNKHTAIVTIVTLVVMLWTANDILTQIRNKPVVSSIVALPNYYFDVAENRLFVASSSELSPIAGPGSHHPEDRTAVRAFVFACHSCADNKDRFIGWIEAFTPEAKEIQAMQDKQFAKPQEDVLSMPPAQANRAIARGRMVGKPDPKNPDWSKNLVPYDSPAGEKILSAWPKACGPSSFPRQCFP